MPNGIYRGRLLADGEGNLLADEGDHKGFPVAYHEGSYVFVQPGEPSHNARHHQNAVTILPTQDQDPDLPGYAGSPGNPTPDNEHHWEPLGDDPHKDGSIKDADAISAIISGHTEAYRD